MKRSAKPIVALHWDGRPSWDEAPCTDATLPEAPTHCWEAAGSARGTRGELWMGDNDLALRALANLRPSSVTLAYMDPPFLTQRVHEKRTFVRRRNAATLHASDEPSHIAAFDDRWRDRATYLESLAVRLTQIKRVLTDDGSVVVHVDPKTSHYVKVLCDEIFGEDAFASEIIWRYRRWPARTPNFQRVHDVLLRYRKDPKAAPCYNQLFEPLAASTVATWGTKKQRAVVGEDGVRARSSRTDAESAGVPMGDVWEIGVIAPVARERTGYPSQKPEALLERLVRALSRPGDTVLDPYAGSGTTLAVAARLGRSFVGMDASPVAEATIVPRLDALGLVRVPAAPPESQTRCAQKLGMAARELPRASLASAKAPRTVTAITPNAAQALYPRRKRA